tara:strand:+ start:653 stop:799 length:147 start_codon:yes stop_codon:yes gene_type:complete
MELLLGLIIGLILGFFGAVHLAFEEVNGMTKEELIDMHNVLRELDNEH